MKTIKQLKYIIGIALIISILASLTVYAESTEQEVKTSMITVASDDNSVPTSRMTISEISLYAGEPFIVINNNIPDFYIWQLTTKPYVLLSPLDKHGRAGAAMACISKDLFPEEVNESPVTVNPSGWQSVRYDDIIEDQYLYNRSHLIAYQFCGDKSKIENAITGTSYLNKQGMLFFEELIANYINQVENGHVLYRVTPVYYGKNRVAFGVQMEALSVEDFGKSVCFNVFVYNVQPGITIDYATGESKVDSAYSKGTEISSAAAFAKLGVPALIGFAMLDTVDSTEQNQPSAIEIEPATEPATEEETTVPQQKMIETQPSIQYVINTNTRKFHYGTCSSVGKMKEKNKWYYTGTRDEIINMGYSPCGNCKP